MHYLGQAVDYNKNRVVAIALPVSKQRQTDHKVYEEVLPLVS